MKTFHKRETITQNITYMAFMAAINIIFSLIATFVPVLSVFLMILLPFTSAVVAIFCKNKYYPIYALATFGLCIAVTAYNMQYTFFYVLPSLVTGFVFGLLIKYKVHTSWIVFITSLVQLGLMYATIPLINLMFDTDLVLTFKTIFGLAQSKSVDVIIPSFIFLLSLAQMTFSYMIISSEIGKFEITLNEKDYNGVYYSIYSLISFALILVFVWFIPSLSYLCMCFGIYFSLFCIYILFKEKKKQIYISLVVSLILFIFLFALLYQYVSDPMGMLLVSILFVLIDSITFCNSLLRIKSKKVIVNSEKERKDV